MHIRDKCVGSRIRIEYKYVYVNKSPEFGMYLPSRPKLLQKTSLQKEFLEAINFVIITKTLCIQLKQTRERPQKYYKNNCFRELFCNNFGQDGTQTLLQNSYFSVGSLRTKPTAVRGGLTGTHQPHVSRVLKSTPYSLHTVKFYTRWMVRQQYHLQWFRLSLVSED